jgi:hypothetical protein
MGSYGAWLFSDPFVLDLVRQATKNIDKAYDVEVSDCKRSLLLKWCNASQCSPSYSPLPSLLVYYPK